MVEVPLFGTKREANEEHFVMLDGANASFELSILPESNGLTAPRFLSWAWSGNLRHSLVLGKSTGEAVLRLPSRPNIALPVRLPRSADDAERFLTAICEQRTSSGYDVMAHAIGTFRQIREALSQEEDEQTVRIFNGLLAAAWSAKEGRIDHKLLASCQTFGDLVKICNEHTGSRIDNLKITETASLGTIVLDFLSTERKNGLEFHPDLLLRHASGTLYQEAHIWMERQPQMSLPGLAPDVAPKGHLRNDVRFTPPSLARTLIQQGLAALGSKSKLRILDPACGSGVFLIESARELLLRESSTPVELHGIDVSNISCAMAQFCVEQLISNQGHPNGSVCITQADALLAVWPEVDMVVMNPPFISWNILGDSEKSKLREILGSRFTGHPDYAMGFISKALNTVVEGGVVCAVLPAPLLETESGREWRESLLETAEIVMVGRFKGYSYFRSSLVEPAFVVMRKKKTPRSETEVTMIFAKEGHEDALLRGLRKDFESSRNGNWEQYRVKNGTLDAVRWTPQPERIRSLLGRYTESGFTKVRDLFEVQQGARTGDNIAFVLSKEEFQTLPSREKTFFRPAAGSKTLRQGRLFPSEYVFYPHGELLNTEDESVLEKLVPQYHQRFLAPRKEVLQKRKGIDSARWWLLTRARSWQSRPEPKLISTYFGAAGSFAYDTSGSYAVVQGYGWHWKKTISANDDGDVEFTSTQLPFSYLAILNSEIFNQFLEVCCPTVQGGQFNLSSRFVYDVYLPDLSDELQQSAKSVQALARVGRRIHEGQEFDVEELSLLCAQAYKLSASDGLSFW